MEQLKAFLEKIDEDSELNAKFNELRMDNAGKDKVIALAAEYGFAITEEDLDNAKKDFDNRIGGAQLSEEELEGVAGGAGLTSFNNCWFTEGNIRSQRKTADGLRFKCCAIVCDYLGIDRCSCYNYYGTTNCQGYYHLVCENSYDLMPREAYNHSKKDKRDYYKAK